VNALADFRLAVGLETLEPGAELFRKRLQRFIDLGKRRGAVHARLALAEHVQVDAMEYENTHRVTRRR
jgi:hypothetical protein